MPMGLSSYLREPALLVHRRPHAHLLLTGHANRSVRGPLPILGLRGAGGQCGVEPFEVAAGAVVGGVNPDGILKGAPNDRLWVTEGGQGDSQKLTELALDPHGRRPMPGA